MPARHLIRYFALALLLALALAAFAACGGGGDDDALGDISASTATDDAGDDLGDDSGDDDSGDDDDDDDDGVGAAEEIEIGETVYHAGFKVLLESASFEIGDFGSAIVKINASFENLASADNATFDSRLAIRQGGTDYIDTADFDADIPAVAARGVARGVLALQVDPSFTFDDATLFIGHPDNNQAIIPLGPDSDEKLITLAPQTITIDGELTAGPVVVNVQSAELRADIPYDYTIEDRQHLALALNFSVTPGEGISVGQGTFLSENVALRQPDGTLIDVRADGQSGVTELLQGKEGTTIDDLVIRFDAEKPVEGEYGLVVTGNWGPGGSEVTGELKFTIPPQTVFVNEG